MKYFNQKDEDVIAIIGHLRLRNFNGGTWQNWFFVVSSDMRRNPLQTVREEQGLPWECFPTLWIRDYFTKLNNDETYPASVLTRLVDDGYVVGVVTYPTEVAHATVTADLKLNKNDVMGMNIFWSRETKRRLLSIGSDCWLK